MLHNYDIVVFSHLRWDFVYQRPQHLLSRLALKSQVFFIEEPIYDPEVEPFLECINPALNVLVFRLHSPVATPGFHDDHLPLLIPMVQEMLHEEGVKEYVVWLYTPMAVPLAQAFSPLAVIYDSMDELSGFLGAPAELLEHEQALFGWADLVFTGGPSIYKFKRDRHPCVYCFSSSVDAAHFRQALTGIPEAADQAALAHPRLGFFGVIDERIDLPLIDALAQVHPEWQIVIVGPVVKIDPASLPRHANILYTGQRNYAQLPTYLTGWDVCLLPFARNDATRFISPTKTLEYMAAERPIVSTPITDVAEPYGDIVYLGDTPAAFIAACERALAASPKERDERIRAMRRVLSQTSWDTTAQAMEQLIEQAVTANSAQAMEQLIEQAVTANSAQALA
ncbi:MAG: glycosyltransferase [Chloroflexota bacterium]|nr:glycosyltransferase [Chloroflexota bacterium]